MGSFPETYNDPKARGSIKKREINCFTFPVKGSERDFGLYLIQTTGPFLCLIIKPGYKIQSSPYFDCLIMCIFSRRPRLVSLTSHYGRTSLPES